MKQYGLLATVFGVTLAVLLVGFLVIEQVTTGGATALASPSPSASAALQTRGPTSAPGSRTPAPSATTMPRPTPPPDEPSPTPDASVAPGLTPRPTPPPVATGTVMDIVVPGTGYAFKDVPVNGTLTKVGAGGLIARTTRDYSDHMTVTYKLPLYQIPAGAKVVRVDVAICGEVSGDFWESYGPPTAEPTEDEVTPPGKDGCWHYRGGTIADTAAFVIIRGETSFTIDKVVYTITTG